MELSKNFTPAETDHKWYQHWLDKGYFNSTPDERPPYTIVIPPPNVTGVLHMGHCLNNTIQDILIRRARMTGFNACWVPGTDHASIATEAKVVQMLREQGIAKSSLSREDFLKHAWQWKEKYGGIILQQLKKLGCSLDWSRTTFTMDPHYYESVIKVFTELYQKGRIYRGKRMINWDVKALTALSDEEVIRKETNQKLYHLQYTIVDENSAPTGNTITIATVRPETIMGDTAVCVHPKDERYTHLHGKFALVPLINRRIPIICDDYVTMEFGTGALKVTPAHDMNDYQLGQKHSLEVVDILNDDGTLSTAAGILAGEDRFAARKKIVVLLEEAGHLLKTEEYKSEVGYSERTDTVVEPRLSLQWWVSMKELSEPALKAVMDEQIRFFPPKFQNLYRHWMENIKDWCISRQLWWGHRIPAWYDKDGNVYVAMSEEKALAQYKVALEERGQTPPPPGEAGWGLSQDEGCLDTWFSSWLWPFEVFKGYSNPDNADVKYYYPGNTLVTAPEIIFFWVARMIMAGYEFKGQLPFTEVYFTGIVRDELGRKMSKQLGNSPDLLGLIEKYGADAVRFGIMIASPAGNDLLFDVKEEASLKQGSFFNNKLWNALKLVQMWSANQQATDHSPLTTHFAVNWFENRLQQVKAEVAQLFKEFRLSEALKIIYSLAWDDFCSWYLEWVKPDYGQPIDTAVYEKTVGFFTELMQLLHPFMPFVTEEIYHLLHERKEDLCIRQLSAPGGTDAVILQNGAAVKEIITALRDARNKAQLKPKDTISVLVQTTRRELYSTTDAILKKQVNATQFSFEGEAPAGSITVVCGADTYFIYSEHLQKDSGIQKEELLKELAYQKGFLESVAKKLNNERFVQNAKPEVVALEQKKKADAEAKIAVLEEGLKGLA
jgi:valyl-tRNA synthetase